jgi:hypothetical protein
MLGPGNRLTRESVETGRSQRGVYTQLVATGTIGVGDSVVHITAAADQADFTVYLPYVGEAAGMVCTVHVTIGDDEVITLEDKSDSPGWSPLTMDADGDYVVLYCDGRYWHILLNGIA